MEKLGKTKVDISKELGICYDTIQKYTEKTWHRVVSDELREKIRSEVKKGKTKIQVAKELNVTYYNVRSYTRDLTQPISPYSKEIIEKIRSDVRNGKSKRQVAIEMQIPYSTIRYYTYYTLFVPSHQRNALSNKTIEEIREGIKEGKTRREIMRELNISPNSINRVIADLPITSCGWAGIRGRTLKILQDVIKNGYVILPSSNNFINGYRTLRKYFPTVRKRVIGWGMQRMTIVFLEEKGIEAMWAVLERTNKNRMISNKKYLQIIDIFVPGRNKEERKKNLRKNK